MGRSTLQCILSLIVFCASTTRVISWTHDGFVKDLKHPQQLFQCFIGKLLIPLLKQESIKDLPRSSQEPSSISTVYLTQKPVSLKEFALYSNQANLPIPAPLSDHNKPGHQSILSGATFTEAQNFCKFYGLDLPDQTQLRHALQLRKEGHDFPLLDNEPYLEWTLENRLLGTPDHRRKLVSRIDGSIEILSQNTRDRRVGFRCSLNLHPRGLSEILLGHQKSTLSSKRSNRHFIRIETEPNKVEVYQDIHMKHRLGVSPYFGSFPDGEVTLFFKGDSIRPRTLKIKTPANHGQVLQLKMEQIPESIFEDSRRSSSMVLIPQGPVRVGLNARAREMVQARILSRTKNTDLDEERTRKYLKNETPERTFFLSDFYMDQTEVTNRQYLQYAEQSSQRNSKCSHVSSLSRPEASVVCVSWNEAQAFCRFYGLELPSEIQFEKAIRGSRENTQKPWHSRPQISGTRHGDESPYGILDLQGNVMEWTKDWFDPDLYREGFILNPKPSNLIRKEKSIRGTSFSPHRLDRRVSKRRHKRPSHFATDLGFRCVSNL